MRRIDPGGTALALGVVLPLVLFLGLVLGPGLRDAPADPAGEGGPAAPLPQASMEVAFLHGEDGVIRVVDTRRDATLRTLPPGEGGFLRGVLRPLERERARHDAPAEAPYHLLRTRDGKLLLRDPASDLEVDLGAFGPTSHQLFNALLTGGPTPPIPPLLSSPSSMEDRP